MTYRDLFDEVIMSGKYRGTTEKSKPWRSSFTGTHLMASKPRAKLCGTPSKGMRI